MSKSWKYTRQVPHAQPTRDHTHWNPSAHLFEIHLAQIPARDNSLILPHCSLPDLCPPERSTDNLLACSLGVWRVSESHWSVFFFEHLNPARVAGGEVKRRQVEEAGVGWPPWRWQRCRLSQEALGVSTEKAGGSWDGEIRRTSKLIHTGRGLEAEIMSDSNTQVGCCSALTVVCP